MMKTILCCARLLLIWILVMGPFFTMAQEYMILEGDTINVVDKNNQKQGKWKYFDNDLNLVLECEYESDKPVGVLKYYKHNRVVLEFEYGDRMRWRFFDEDTVIAGYSRADRAGTYHYFADGRELTEGEVYDIFSVYETEVVFEGGHQALLAYLSKNVRYPKGMEHRNVEGEVYVSFTVDKHGYVRDVKVVKGLEREFNQEAVRVVESMPRWQPGTHRGYTVNIRRTVSVPFRSNNLLSGMAD